MGQLITQSKDMFKGDPTSVTLGSQRSTASLGNSAKDDRDDQLGEVRLASSSEQLLVSKNYNHPPPVLG